MTIFTSGLGFNVGADFGDRSLNEDFWAKMFVAEFADNEVSQIDPAGNVSHFAAIPAPGDVKFDPSGFYGDGLFASTAFTGPIWYIDQNGNAVPFSPVESTYLAFGPGGP